MEISFIFKEYKKQSYTVDKKFAQVLSQKKCLILRNGTMLQSKSSPVIFTKNNLFTENLD